MTVDAKTLNELSERATPGVIRTGGIYSPNGSRPTTWLWGPTPAGMQSGQVVTKEVSLPDAKYLAALWNGHRSGDLIPRSGPGAAVSEEMVKAFEAHLVSVGATIASSTWRPIDLRLALEAALALAPRTAGDDGWRDIASAPRNGTYFLGTKAGRGDTTWIASADEHGNVFTHAPWHRTTGKGLTHWRPLPAPPPVPSRDPSPAPAGEVR